MNIGFLFNFLFIFDINFVISSSVLFTCDNTTTSYNFCRLCGILGSKPSDVPMSSWYDGTTCAMYIGLNDYMDTVTSIPQRCETYFQKFMTVECQLSTFIDPSMITFYMDNAIITNTTSILIGLSRNGCNNDWYWNDFTGNISYSNTNQNLPCDITQGAMNGSTILEVNPITYNQTGFLCQCISSSLYVTTSSTLTTSLSSTSSTIMFSSTSSQSSPGSPTNTSSSTVSSPSVTTISPDSTTKMSPAMTNIHLFIFSSLLFCLTEIFSTFLSN